MADKELSPLQKEFREFFSGLLEKFGVGSPAELTDDQKKEFFNSIAKYWENGVGPKKEPKDIKVEESLFNESPVGQRGRTSREEAMDFIAENPQIIKEIKKIIRETGGKVLFMEVLKAILTDGYDEENFKLKDTDIDKLRHKKIQQVLKGTFL